MIGPGFSRIYIAIDKVIANENYTCSSNHNELKDYIDPHFVKSGSV